MTKAKKNKRVTKAGIVREMNGAKPADIVAEAAKRGVTLDARYVYKVRNKIKRQKAAEVAPARTKAKIPILEISRADITEETIPMGAQALSAGLDMLHDGKGKQAERFFEAAKVLLGL